MRPAFITDEASQDPGSFLPLARQCSISRVELRSVWNTHVMELDRGQKAELRQRLDDGGVAVCCIASPVFKSHVQDDERAALEKLKRAVDTAGFFDAPLVRVFSFWRAEHRDAHLPRVRDILWRATAVVAGSRVRLGIENGRRTMHAPGRELGQLLRELDTPALAAVWDPSNALTSGLEPRPVIDGYPHVAPYVAHVHLKDPLVSRDGPVTFVDIGSGDLGVDRQIESLRADHYTGCVSLETHWRPDRRLAPAALDHPQGEAFSAGGYHATHLSLQRLGHFLTAD